METKQKQRSERFKRKVLARWRLLATSGVSFEQAALEIGVTADQLRAWARSTGDEAPLLVPVQVADATAERRALVVFAGGLRVEGLTVAEVAELVRRCGGCRDRRAGARAGVRVSAARRLAQGLGALVQQALGKDPLSGALFLFTNRRRTTAKVLQFDGTGMTLYIKRLARGRFAALWDGDDGAALSLTRPELELFLQGSQLVGKMPLAPAMMSEKDLVIRA